METNELVVMAIVGLVGVIVTLIGVFLVTLKGKTNQFLVDLLPKLHPIIQDAIKFAALFVEKLDRDGVLSEWVGEIREKGEQKLNLAVDIAVEKAEEMLEAWFASIGLTVNIDIPEQVIKDLIQKYVLENPELFPSRKVVSAVSTESAPQFEVIIE